MNNGYNQFSEIHDKVVSDIRNVVEIDCWWNVFDDVLFTLDKGAGIGDVSIYEQQN